MGTPLECGARAGTRGRTRMYVQSSIPIRRVREGGTGGQAWTPVAAERQRSGGGDQWAAIGGSRAPPETPLARRPPDPESGYPLSASGAATPPCPKPGEPTAGARRTPPRGRSSRMRTMPIDVIAKVFASAPAAVRTPPVPDRTSSGGMCPVAAPSSSSARRPSRVGRGGTCEVGRVRIAGECLPLASGSGLRLVVAERGRRFACPPKGRVSRCPRPGPAAAPRPAAPGAA